MKIDIYPPEQQGYGEFDHGNIREQKPIGFRGEGSVISRTGPLFYWAWMHAEGPGRIEMHPHQAFEIMTYLIKGEGRHIDSLGNDKILEAGGVQVMQAGSGMNHEEQGGDMGMEGFQIWLEPNIVEALKRPPVYRDFMADEFDEQAHEAGVLRRRLVGPGTPVDFLHADAQIEDINFTADSKLVWNLASGRYLNILAIRKDAELSSTSESRELGHKDYAVLFADADESVTIAAPMGARLICIEVPRNPGYRLYNKG